MEKNDRIKRGTIVLAALAVIGAVVLLLPSTAVETLAPVEKAARFVRTRIFSRFAGAFRGAAANAENVRLRREVASLALLVGEVERLEEENARLRRTLAYRERHAGEWLAASVLSRDGGAGASGDLLRVDKGSDEGVRKGAVVIVPEGLVGLVVDTTASTARIRLLTDPALKVSCVIPTAEGEVRGVLAGGSDERLVFRYFQDGATAPANSKVVTSGRGGVFPAGIAVGDSLGFDERGPVGVRPAVDFANLEDVFIRREK